MEYLIIFVIIVIVMLLLRAFGAWMLRIDEVIKNQKEIVDELKRINRLP
jgi:hypothetical protein